MFSFYILVFVLNEGDVSSQKNLHDNGAAVGNWVKGLLTNTPDPGHEFDNRT